MTFALSCTRLLSAKSVSSGISSLTRWSNPEWRVPGSDFQGSLEGFWRVIRPLIFVGLFSAPLSMITTVDHDHHRFRRETLSNSFFQEVCNQYDATHSRGIGDINGAFWASLSGGSCFRPHGSILCTDRCQCFNSLHEEDFKNNTRGGILELESTNHLNRFVPSLIPLLQYMAIVACGIFQACHCRHHGGSHRTFTECTRKNSQQDLEKRKQTMVQALSLPAIPADGLCWVIFHDSCYGSSLQIRVARNYPGEH